ncbi:MAG: endo-1,4-beta-xylanase [Clostridiales bacterium]|nr:endo-1,4-beta-xylanase [Clostridiales bacterium]
MKLANKKSKMLKNVKRTMAVTLSFAMIGTYFGVQSANPLVAKAATNGIYEDFETDVHQGMQMGDVKLKTTKKAYKGNGALYVEGRQQDWNSYSYDVSAFAGKTIQFSAFMRVDKANLNGVACLKTTINGEDNYTWIANKALKKGKYVKLDAEYAIPAGATATIYFGTCNTKDNSKQTTDPFYLDDVSISSDVSVKENFNDAKDTSALKGSVFGNPTLKIVKNGKGGKALQVSDRTENYFGYAYDLSAFAGNKISLTAKISAVGVKKGAKNTFNATLKSGDDDYKQVATVTTKGTATATLACKEYTIPAGASSYNIYFEGPKDVTYKIDDIEIAVVGDYVDPTTKINYVDVSQYPILKNLYRNNFKMGVACEAISNWGNELSEIGNKNKEDLIKQEFNSITFGNELKPAYNMGYSSKRATETFLPFVINPAAKEMLDWAKANKMKVRGHVLVWHSQCEDAVFCKNYTPVKTDGENLDASCLVDRKTMLKRMKSYIYDTMKYMYKNGYADTIYAWDVVNEAIEPGTNEYNMRDSYWYKTIGPDFIYYAFKYAREAENKYSVAYAAKYKVDPKDEKQLDKIRPDLFYNDYNEFQAEKCDAIIKMTSEDFAGHNILKEGYIDGIGMQGHLSDNTDIESYMKAAERYSDAVGQVQITELDVAQTTTGVNAEYYQAKFYRDFFQALSTTRANITGVTIWGLTDDNSWKKESSPLIFNADLSKKLAFDGIASVKNGTELPAPAYEAPDFKDMIADFEGEGVTTDGFAPRGDGQLSIQSEVTHSGKAALKDSGRTASWNGVSFDVSRFVGQTIEVNAWIKTAAPEAKLSADIDGVWPNIAVIDTKDGDWKQVKATYKVPSDMTSLRLYFEASTDKDDIYIDDFSLKLKGMEEGFEEASNIASARGVGHMPSFAAVTDAESHNEKGHSFLVKRAEQDASMKFDVSKYIGYTVNVKAFVKTADSKIRLGLDGAEPVQLTEVASDGNWTEVTATYPLSNQLTSAAMYIETDGKADFYVDDISVTIADFTEDCETEAAANVFSPRWGGAGTLSIVEDGANNHAAVLKERTETYMGVAFDVSPYLGMEVEISMDVKTDDSKIMMTGDINDVWPQYANFDATKGQYKNIKAVVKLPSDLQTLRVYVETDGKSDLYVDNLKIKRVVE